MFDYMWRHFPNFRFDGQVILHCWRWASCGRWPADGSRIGRLFSVSRPTKPTLRCLFGIKEMPRKYRGKKSPLLCCCVPGCLENSNRSRQAKFHPVPEEDSALGRRKQAKWLKALGVNFKPTQKSRVCETHFKLYPRNSESRFNEPSSHSRSWALMEIVFNFQKSTKKASVH